MFWKLAATSPLLLGPLKLSKSATNVANSLFVTRSLEVCRNASDKSSAFSCLDAVTLHLIALSGVQGPPQFLKETKGLRFNIGVTSMIATGCDFSAKSLRNAMRCLGKFGCNVGPVGLIFFISSSGVFGISCRRTLSVLSQPHFPSFLKFPLVTHLHHHSQLLSHSTFTSTLSRCSLHSTLIIYSPVEFPKHVGHGLDLHLHPSRCKLTHKRAKVHRVKLLMT